MYEIETIDNCIFQCSILNNSFYIDLFSGNSSTSFILLRRSVDSLELRLVFCCCTESVRRMHSGLWDLQRKEVVCENS